MPMKKKIWAIKHGFFPSSVELYELNGFSKDNHRGYLSDFDYKRSYPLNNYFKLWIDDKITTKYIFQDARFKDFMPRYFIYIEPDGHYTYLMDFDMRIAKDSNVLLNLLKAEKVLALKPLKGSGGFGFIRLEYIDGAILSNGKVLSVSDYGALTSKLNGYLVSEYCFQHSSLADIWPKSECTLRIVTARISDMFGGGVCKTFISYARIGTERSGSTSNLSQGGVAVPIDFETGIFGDNIYRYKKFDPDNCFIHESHPDTKMVLRGKKLPNWDMVKSFIDDFTNYVSSLEYFGFDVIITEDGFKICEINSHPVLDIEQVICKPVLEDDFVRRFFESKLSKLN